MIGAGGTDRVRRPQRLALIAAVLVVLAASGSVVLSLLRLPQALAVLPALLALLALVPIAMLFSHLRRAAEMAAQAQRVAETKRLESERNQQAIMRLLDEMSSLAEGDLTVQATVTEDITGAIADSVNYAVEALRKLVTTISQSGIQLDGAARQTQALASHLARASNAQSKQIGSATESIGAMASSIEEVSGNAERGADVARHSVDVAHKGGDAVRRTIDGMNTIRETIQETSKRIKRLGESSQEIGNIIELISDIAEQTNILALNASIQASMAGEAGRGLRWWPTRCNVWPNAPPMPPSRSRCWCVRFRPIPMKPWYRWSAALPMWSAARCWRKMPVPRCRRLSKCRIRSPVWCRTFPRARAVSPRRHRTSHATCRCCARSVRSRPIRPAPPRTRSPSLPICRRHCASPSRAFACPAAMR